MLSQLLDLAPWKRKVESGKCFHRYSPIQYVIYSILYSVPCVNYFFKCMKYIIVTNFKLSQKAVNHYNIINTIFLGQVEVFTDNKWKTVPKDQTHFLPKIEGQVLT